MKYSFLQNCHFEIKFSNRSKQGGSFSLSESTYVFTIINCIHVPTIINCIYVSTIINCIHVSTMIKIPLSGTRRLTAGVGRPSGTTQQDRERVSEQQAQRSSAGRVCQRGPQTGLLLRAQDGLHLLEAGVRLPEQRHGPGDSCPVSLQHPQAAHPHEPSRLRDTMEPV